MQPENTPFDPMGNALAAYYAGKKASVIQVRSSIAEEDQIPVSYLFREFDNMPELEQIALEASVGKILDIGAGAGSHALYLQQKGLEVTGLEISEGAAEVMKARGLQKVVAQDFSEVEPTGKFDTILLLMNGIGLAGTLDRLPEFFQKLQTFLAKGGQVLLESSDILYMYEDEDGSVSLDLNGAYYGEVEYQMVYEAKAGPRFPWLFVDPLLLEDYAQGSGFKIEFLYEGENGEYLARLF